MNNEEKRREEKRREEKRREDEDEKRQIGKNSHKFKQYYFGHLKKITTTKQSNLNRGDDENGISENYTLGVEVAGQGIDSTGGYDFGNIWSAYGPHGRDAGVQSNSQDGNSDGPTD